MQSMTIQMLPGNREAERGHGLSGNRGPWQGWVPASRLRLWLNSRVTRQARQTVWASGPLVLKYMGVNATISIFSRFHLLGAQYDPESASFASPVWAFPQHKH